MVTLFGIKNCDTVKKALKWLEREGVPHQFHDFRKDGLDEALVDRFLTSLDYSALINLRGTTWRKLSDDQKVGMNAAKARDLMLTYDAIIKRPVWLFDDGVMCVGFAKKEQKVNDDHKPVIITRQNGKPAIVMSVEGFHSYEETAYLMASPKNAERLHQAIAEVESGKTVKKELIE